MKMNLLFFFWFIHSNEESNSVQVLIYSINDLKWNENIVVYVYNNYELWGPAGAMYYPFIIDVERMMKVDEGLTGFSRK